MAAIWPVYCRHKTKTPEPSKLSPDSTIDQVIVTMISRPRIYVVDYWLKNSGIITIILVYAFI